MKSGRGSIAWLACGGVALLALSGAFLLHALSSWEGANSSPRLGHGIRAVDVSVACLIAGLGSAIVFAFGKRRREADAANKRCWGILERSVDGFVAVDEADTIVFVSRTIARLFGYEATDLLGWSLRGLLQEKPQSMSAHALDEMIAGHSEKDDEHPVVEVAGRCKDGREMTLESRVGPALPMGGGRLAKSILLRDITRAKQTREMLCAHEAHLRLVVEQMPAILWTTDAHLRITSTLGAGLAALNLQPQEVIGMSMLECLDRGDMESTPIDAHLKAVRGESLSYEMDWKGRTFQVRVDPLRKPSKKIIGTVGILLDVTERKQTEKELKARDRQQAAVACLGLRALNGLALPTLMKEAADAVSQTLEVEFCQVLEYLPEDKEFRSGAVAGLTFQGRDTGLIGGPGSQAAYTLEASGAVIVEELRTEKRFRAPQPLITHGLVSAVSTAVKGKNGPLAVLAVATSKRRAFGKDDLHFLQAVANVIAAAIERRRGEEDQNRLVAILEATPDIVAIADQKHQLSYVNGAGRAVLGISEGEDVSLYALADFYPNELRGAVLADGIRTAVSKGVWSGETVLQGRSGKTIPVSQVMLSHRRPGGSVQFFSTVARDLSERQHLEEQFRQAQKMDAIGKLAGGVAHDFNNLLCIITGYSSLMLAKLPEEGPLRSFTAEIHKAGERAASLTSQLLAFSRKQMLVLQTLNLNALVLNTEKMLRRLIGEDIRLVTALDPKLSPIRADPGQVEQILMNLAVNSRDAMPQGGTLSLRTSNVVLDAESVRMRSEVRPGAYALLSVVDSGCGMSKEVQCRLFEPFFTTKPVGKGTGLGLATVYGIVKQFGGHVEAESAPGMGTTFRVYLPHAEEVSTAPTPPSPVNVPGGDETVLLVEDEEGVRSLARKVLEGKGYSVLEACDGVEALAICKRHTGSIDLLLTDAVMPNLSGSALSRKIKALRPMTKVLFMSGFTDSALLRHGVMSGEVECLLKPFSTVALAEAVRGVLDNVPFGSAAKK